MSWQRVPAGRVLSADDKALPAWAAGMDAEAFVARGVRLSELWTPALVVDASALEDAIDVDEMLPAPAQPLGAAARLVDFLRAV